MPGPRPVSLVFAAIPLVCLCGASCTEAPDPEPLPRLSIGVNVWAVGWLVTQIGGDLVEPRQLEAGAHDRPTEDDVELLKTVDAVIYVGHMSDEAQALIDDRWPPGSEEANRFTDVSRLSTVELLTAPPELDPEERLPDDIDPHVWLDPVNMAEIAVGVQRAVTEAILLHPELGESRRDYDEALDNRLDEVMGRLDGLHREIDGALQPCRGLTVVAEHPAYQYLTARYGLDQLPITPFVGGVLDPDVASRQRRELADLWSDVSTRTIFLEDSYGYGPDRITDDERNYMHKISNDLNATLSYLSSLEEAPSTGDGDGTIEGYVEAMQQNVATIGRGLGC